MLGGIGAGKSYVARRTAQLAPGVVVDADAIAHQGLAIFAADGRLAAAVGPEFVKDGQPDVKTLGARAFKDPALLRRLERLVHPHCHAAIKEAVAAHRAGQGPRLLVLDVALLIEVGLDRSCDALWYVDVADDIRAERAGQRGLTLEQIRLREAFQSPRERKRARADLIIHNNADGSDDSDGRDPDGSSAGRNDAGDVTLDGQILAGLEQLGVRPAKALVGDSAATDPGSAEANGGGPAARPAGR